MGPSYPLRVVTPASLGLLNFWGPLLFVAAASILLVRLSRRDPVRRIGLALFFVPLIPPMNVNAFIPEQIVHDRYLYLPLLGLLMVVVPAFAETVQRRLAPSTAGPRAESAAAAGAPPVVSPAAAGSRLAARVREGGRPDPSSRTGDSLLGASRAQKATVYAAVLCCVPLSLKTLSYNRAWTSEMNLWSAAISSDPTSATNYAEYGRVLLTAGRTAEAKAALDRAVSIFPVTTAYLQRADLAVTERRFADAESDLKLVLASYPDNNAAYERLAIVYQQQGRLPEAEALLRTAREKIPHRRCSFTDSLAVVLYLEGRKSDALQELESVRADAPRELGSSAQSVLFHLGSLYSELGRTSDARSALEEYLRLSAGLTDKQSIEYRNQARTNLSRLPG
jgi:tetratricopeptide (TPR) repeat protein